MLNLFSLLQKVMGPTQGNLMVDTKALSQQQVNMLFQQQQQQQHLRNRNVSGGSLSSNDSNSDLKPVFTATPTVFNPLAATATDLGALTLLLSAGGAEQVQPDSSKANGGSRYKTEMCRSFMETGQCKYGDKCQFAHGHQEQRAMPRHPKYKTELCRTFHTTGLCPYGTRCHFIHNEDPLKLGAIMQAKQCFLAQQATQEIAKKSALLLAERNKLYSQMTLLQQQLFLNNLIFHNTVTPRPTVVSAPQQQQVVQQAVMAQEMRKRTSLGSVGSIADSPPVSPICGSPMFDASHKRSPPGFAPKTSAEVTTRSAVRPAFDFSDYTSSADIDSNSVTSSGPMSCYTPPSSPDSYCTSSPTESPKLCRASRLPVFSRLAGHSS